jgi:virginiamycin B lyase
LFITETFAASIVEYNQTSQEFVKYWKLQLGAQPVGISVNDSAENIWFTNHGSSQFGRVDEKTGMVSYFATSLFSFNYTDSSGVLEETLPYWIQQSPNGAIWFDEHVGNKITRFNSTSGELTEFIIPTPNSSPLRFAQDNRNGIVWFTEFQGNKLGMLDENQTCGCDVIVSPRQTTLTGETSNLTIGVVTPDSSLGSQPIPLVSGTFSDVGDVTSNLTISFRPINSTAYEAVLTRGADLAAGNFSLTLCDNDNNSQIRECGVALISVQVNPSPSTLDYLVIAIVAGFLVVISSTYVIRWRKRNPNSQPVPFAGRTFNNPIMKGCTLQ